MKFALLIFDDEEAWSKMEDAQRKAVLDGHTKFYELLSERKIFAGGQQFASSNVLDGLIEG